MFCFVGNSRLRKGSQRTDLLDKTGCFSSFTAPRPSFDFLTFRAYSLTVLSVLTIGRFDGGRDDDQKRSSLVRAKVGGAAAMNKTDLAEYLSKELKISVAKAEKLINMLFGSIGNALASGERVEIKGFGSFTVRDHKEIIGTDRKTGEKITVGPKRLPFFNAGRLLKARLNEAKRQEPDTEPGEIQRS